MLFDNRVEMVVLKQILIVTLQLSNVTFIATSI